MKILKYKFWKFKKDTILSFQFTFDNYLTDNCIVYNINNPLNFACENSYLLTSKEYKQIVNTIYKLIDKR